MKALKKAIYIYIYILYIYIMPTEVAPFPSSTRIIIISHHLWLVVLAVAVAMLAACMHTSYI